MSRVNIQLPEKQIFQTEIRLRLTDINYGGHLGNDSVLSLMHESRYRMINAFGYQNELEIDGIGTIQLDTAIQYMGEAFHGDMVKVSVYLGDLSSRTFDVFYKLEVEDKLIALGKTGIACFDYEKRKLASIPPDFKAQLLKD